MSPAGVQKIGAIVSVSKELLQRSAFLPAPWQPDTRTDEQKASDRAAREEVERERRATVSAAHIAALAGADAFRRAVLELHAPVFGEYSSWPVCEGCDMNGYEAEAPEHPCRTYELAAGAE